MNWGKWIVVSFILFAVFIGVLVTVCVREDINLVSKNYYSDELAYQQQIDRINNTSQLEEKPRLLVVDQALEIHFNQFNNLDKGELILFRPSDVRFDKKFILHAASAEVQKFDVSHLTKGMYRAKMQWTMNGKEYFFENILNL